MRKQLREDTMMAGLIVMNTLSPQELKNFHQWISKFGTLPIERAAGDYPRMQIFSVPETLEGKRFETPTPMGRARSAQNNLLQ